ncbi:HEAT repeat domain-containing protein [candidate division WOR-3 bacterium]|nr:HEAT repeat domain-containing protein [candidate division WOR-3 bacterium]
MVLLEKNIIVENLNIDTSDSPTLRNFTKRLRRIGVDSVTIDTDCTYKDIEGFIEVVAHPPRDIKLYDDINTLLIERRVDRVYFNAVEFKIKSKDEEWSEDGWGGLGIGGFGWGGDEEFDINGFMEKGCGLKGGESPGEEASKVTKGLIRLYDQIVSKSGEEGLRDNVTIFNTIITHMSPEAKRELLTNKIKLKKISEIIKSTIMTFSDEEIIELFVSKTKLLGVLKAGNFLEGLSPDRLDRILPEIKKELSSLTIQEEYVKQLEEALWEKGGPGKEKYGKRGGYGTENISGFVKHFRETSETDYGKKEISNFFHSICGLKKGESNQVAKILDGFEAFIKEFEKQYKKDDLLKHTGKIQKIFMSAPDPLRKKIFMHILERGEHLQKTMAKIILPILKDETIVSGIIKMLDMNNRKQLIGFLSSMESDRLSSLNKILKAHLEKRGWEEKAISELWTELTSTPTRGRSVSASGKEGPSGRGGMGDISKKAYQRLYRRLKTGMDITEVSSLLKSLYKSLESGSPEVRINTLNTIKGVLVELFEGEKTTILKRMIDQLKEMWKIEEDPEVYSKYTEIIGYAGVKAENLGFDFIAKEIVALFAKEVGDIKKAEAIIPQLSEFKMEEARNVLFSLLWEDRIREQVKEKLVNLDPEITPYIMELLSETEDKDVRLTLMGIIESFGLRALDIVSKYLRDKRWYVRRNAVRLLGIIGDSNIIDDILKLKSDDERVQIEIIRSIRHILKAEAEPYIIEFFNSDSPKVEQYAIMSLGNVVSGKSLPELNKRLLEKRFSSSAELEIKKTLCVILGEVGGTSSLKSLGEIINAKKMLGRPQYPEELRIRALKAVEKIGGSVAKEIIDGLKKDSSKKIRALAEGISDSL